MATVRRSARTAVGLPVVLWWGRGQGPDLHDRPDPIRGFRWWIRRFCRQLSGRRGRGLSRSCAGRGGPSFPAGVRPVEFRPESGPAVVKGSPTHRTGVLPTMCLGRGQRWPELSSCAAGVVGEYVGAFITDVFSCVRAVAGPGRGRCARCTSAEEARQVLRPWPPAGCRRGSRPGRCPVAGRRRRSRSGSSTG